MASPSQPRLMTTVATPAAASRARCRSSRLVPPTSSRAFGTVSVSGRMRSPRPAASTMAIVGLATSVIGRTHACHPGQHLVLDQVSEDLERRVAGRDLEDVRQGARHVAEVTRLAVAMTEPRENAGGLEVPLHAHELETREELLLAKTAEQLTVERGEMGQRPVAYPLRGPADVAVLEQGHEIVGERTLDGILEVEDSGVGRLGDHEVARMIIAMHEHPRLVERVRDEQVAAGGP